MPSGFLPGRGGKAYLIGSIVMIVLGIVLSILTFTGAIGGGTVLAILWIVVALAGAVVLVDALQKG